MVRKICVTIPEELDNAINTICEAVSEKIKMKASKSKVITLLLDAGIQQCFPSMVEEKGESDGH